MWWRRKQQKYSSKVHVPEHVLQCSRNWLLLWVFVLFGSLSSQKVFCSAWGNIKASADGRPSLWTASASKKSATFLVPAGTLSRLFAPTLHVHRQKTEAQRRFRWATGQTPGQIHAETSLFFCPQASEVGAAGRHQPARSSLIEISY